MRNVQLRVPLGLGQRLQEIVFARGREERVAFCLVSHVETDAATILLVRDVIALDESDYLAPDGHGARWRGAALFPILTAAVDQTLGVLLVHAHAFGDPPSLSRDDRDCAARLLPMLKARVPQRPHGSIVLSPGSAGGVLALPDSSPEEANVEVRWIGSSIIDWPSRDDGAGADDDVFDRQALVVGNQGVLSRSSVAVVGLCGGGSHFVQQLAHAGVGTIYGIDADVCEPVNLPRKVGMRRADGDARLAKTTTMGRLVREIGGASRFVPVPARVPEPAALDALRRADVIVGCVDNLQTRADLQEFAWRHVVPFVDVGVGIRARAGTATEPRVGVGGNVLVLLPGGFCMWCCNFLSEEKLRNELQGRTRSYFENKSGEAQVISFNGVVASQGVSEIIQLLTGFRGASLEPRAVALDEQRQRGVLKYDGLRGTLEDWGAQRHPNCACCGELLGAGTTAWAAVGKAGVDAYASK